MVEAWFLYIILNVEYLFSFRDSNLLWLGETRQKINEVVMQAYSCWIDIHILKFTIYIV
jgi:hypothetical protein